MDWKEMVKRWRALSKEEELHRHLERLPENMVQSIAFESEPVPPGWIEKTSRELGLPPKPPKKPGQP